MHFDNRGLTIEPVCRKRVLNWRCLQFLLLNGCDEILIGGIDVVSWRQLDSGEGSNMRKGEEKRFYGCCPRKTILHSRSLISLQYKIHRHLHQFLRNESIGRGENWAGQVHEGKNLISASTYHNYLWTS